MKRWMMIAMAVVLMATLGSFGVFAQQEESQTSDQPAGTMGPGMGRGRMMMGGGAAHMQGCPICCAMVESMVLKTMTPTQDGGVIVAFGNKLMRYDSQLKLIAEAEMQINADQMFSSMQKMMENCPMCKQMQQQSQQQAQVRP